MVGLIGERRNLDMAERRTTLEIKYCVAWGYLPQAAWIATEFFTEFQNKLEITITPVDDGRLEIYLDTLVIFDRKAEGGHYPGLDKIRELKKVVRDRVAVTV